jgi:hypothetical protein
MEIAQYKYSRILKRSLLFSRLDLLNMTDPGEAVRNVEYML